MRADNLILKTALCLLLTGTLLASHIPAVTASADETKSYTVSAADVETETDSETEPVSEAATEVATEITTEAATESTTEAATESATESETETGEVTGCKIITSLEEEASLSQIPTVTILQNFNNDLTPLLYAVFEYFYINASVLCPDGTTETVRLSVDWNVSHYDRPQIDVSVPGHYTETGTVLLPDGYCFADGVPQQIVIPVEVTAQTTPAVITILDDFSFWMQSCALELGTPAQTLTENFLLPTTLTGYDADGYSHSCSLVWDTGCVDHSTAGLYQMTARIEPPENAVFAETLVLPVPSVTVSIQEPANPDINCWYYDSGSYLFPWVTPPGNLDNTAVWMSENGGEWICISEKYPDEVGVYEEFLYLYQTLFTSGHTYRIQVDYDGGQTPILTFHFDDSMILDQYMEGDRDGGDFGGSTSDGLTQPAPETETETDSETEPETQLPDASWPTPSAPSGTESEFLEYFGEDQDIISGTRLHMMLEASGEARFSKHGITVCLSRSALNELNIHSRDRFAVSIQTDSPDSFTLCVTRNDQVITYLPDTLLMLPRRGDAGTSGLLLLNAAGEAVALGKFTQNSVAAFTIDAPGTYFIWENVPAARFAWQMLDFFSMTPATGGTNEIDSSESPSTSAGSICCLLAVYFSLFS